VRVTYNRVVDEIVTSHSREDYGIFLVFDVFAAVGLLPQPTVETAAPMGGALSPVRF
jgi:hypothetical protein